jgi:hypothetical protein
VLLDILTRIGPETVERFACAWHGPPQGKASPEGATPDVPEPLRSFYDVAMRWPDLIVQNSFVRPPERVGDRVVFYVENQGLCSWMTSGSRGDDASVWAEATEGEVVIEDEPLSRFLVTVAILEAVLASREATPESDDYRSVWVGARDRSALSALDSIMDKSWEYDSRRD